MTSIHASINKFIKRWFNLSSHSDNVLNKEVYITIPEGPTGVQKQGPTGVQKQGPTYVQKQIVSIHPTVSASEDQDNCYIRPTTPGIKWRDMPECQQMPCLFLQNFIAETTLQWVGKIMRASAH